MTHLTLPQDTFVQHLLALPTPATRADWADAFGQVARTLSSSPDRGTASFAREVAKGPGVPLQLVFSLYGAKVGCSLGAPFEVYTAIATTLRLAHEAEREARTPTPVWTLGQQVDQLLNPERRLTLLGTDGRFHTVRFACLDEDEPMTEQGWRDALEGGRLTWSRRIEGIWSPPSPLNALHVKAFFPWLRQCKLERTRGAAAQAHAWDTRVDPADIPALELARDALEWEMRKGAPAAVAF